MNLLEQDDVSAGYGRPAAVSADRQHAALAARQMQGVVAKLHGEIAAPDHDGLGRPVVMVPPPLTFTKRTFTPPSCVVSSLRPSRTSLMPGSYGAGFLHKRRSSP